MRRLLPYDRDAGTGQCATIAYFMCARIPQCKLGAVLEDASHACSLANFAQGGALPYTTTSYD
jgi:hypothetical protein